MIHQSKRQKFADLHKPGEPLLLYNIWDAGSAIAVAESGAEAIATGSHPLSGSQGYADGEVIPLNRLLETARQIIIVVDCPVTVDFEGGYSADAAHNSEHAALLAETGAVGCNFEDQIVNGKGLHSTQIQSARIEACAASGLFVNARTDLFLEPLRRGDDPNQQGILDQALERARAFAGAGAGSFFAPGLTDLSLVEQLCKDSPLPVNILMMPGLEIGALAETGVARISWGGAPWRGAMALLQDAAREVFGALR